VHVSPRIAWGEALYAGIAWGAALYAGIAWGAALYAGIAWGAALYANFYHTPPRPFQKLQVIGEAHSKHRVRASACLIAGYPNRSKTVPVLPSGVCHRHLAQYCCFSAKIDEI
jgi:hypothetical protein